ncbi:hypothetical protein K492DRAFT_185652 [Lichtheimia hyalospora FSU 10163]|nr:hypothetical protein K492DRAFT_185652 [Lichtheimia hyalospora FSU 10163]
MAPCYFTGTGDIYWILRMCNNSYSDCNEHATKYPLSPFGYLCQVFVHMEQGRYITAGHVYSKASKSIDKGDLSHGTTTSIIGPNVISLNLQDDVDIPCIDDTYREDMATTKQPALNAHLRANLDVKDLSLYPSLASAIDCT